jgi:gamma-glutamyltranspeptidase/glutathione hydrolase
VADAEGNVASLSTSNGEASGYVVPGTGVMLNNMLGEDDLHPDGFHASPPGVRVSSMMAPTVVLGADGVELVLGSGGSARIRTAILQTISAVVDFGLDPADAVGRPRIHWDGAAFQVEPGFASESVAALAELGPINAWAELNLYFGGVHAVSPYGHGGGDPRRAGACLTR